MNGRCLGGGRSEGGQGPSWADSPEHDNPQALGLFLVGGVSAPYVVSMPCAHDLFCAVGSERGRGGGRVTHACAPAHAVLHAMSPVKVAAMVWACHILVPVRLLLADCVVRVRVRVSVCE